MKKTFVFVALIALANFAFATGEPSAKVLTAFKRQFGQPTGVVWTAKDKTAFALFNLNGISYQLSYGHHGNLLASIKRYGKKQLPRTVRSVVQANYAGFDVYGVTEVQVNGDKVYEIYLQNAGYLLTARANDDGEMQETGRHQKPRYE